MQLRSLFWFVVLLAGGAVGGDSFSAAAQTSAAAGPLAFEVVSIRQTKDAGECTRMQEAVTADGYHLRNCRLMIPLLTAFRPLDMGDDGFYLGDRVAGVPDWMNEARYDIDARVADADLPGWQDPVRRREMIRTMVGAMLAERFKLAAHREWKEVTGLSLVVGKSGAKLKPAASRDIKEVLAKHPDGEGIPGGQGGAVLVTHREHSEFTLYNSTTTTLALLLTLLTNRAVVDKTGIVGVYDFELHATMDNGPSMNTAEDNAPSIYTAVQEQLGLKLEQEKNKVEELMIDHVERPSEN